MKRTVIALVSVLIAPIAFAQTNAQKSAANTAERVTVTGTMITATEDGAAANYQPAKTLVIRQDDSNKPARYVLNGPGHVLSKSGEIIQTAIKPGARVRVFYTSDGDTRLVDHIVVMD